MTNPDNERDKDVVVTDADVEVAREWSFMECYRCSEYEGNFVADLAADIAAHRTAATAALRERVDKLEELLDELQSAEANYRHCHDVYGDRDMKSGRAWDLMRRRGNAARSALAAKEPTR